MCSQDALCVSCTHRLHMHGNTLTLYIPRTIQDFHAHLYVLWAIQDFYVSIVLPKGRIDYIRPLGHIGFSCIYSTSLGPYRMFMHPYVPWAVWDLHAAIRPLGRIGFSCIYMSLGPYRIFMHLYVPWAI